MSVAPPVSAARTRARDAWVALALILVGTALRFLLLGQQSFWHDEVHSVLMARGDDSGALTETVFNTHGPLYLLMLRGWMHCFGSGEAAARALSALIGVAGLVAFHRVVRRWVSPGTGLVALALLAISPFHLGYSQEVRGYGLLFLTGLLAVEATLVDIERRTPATFVVALVATMATCLSNLSGFFLVGLMGVFGWTLGRSRGYTLRRYALFAVLVAVLLEPWIVAGLQTTGKFNIGTPPVHSAVVLVKGESPPGPASIPYSFYDFTLGRALGPNVDDLKLYRFPALVPHLVYVLPAMLLVGWLLLRGWRRMDAATRSVLGPWLVLPIVFMAVISTVNVKAANSRYAFLGFAPYVLMIAQGVSSIVPPRRRALTLGALLLLFAVADVQYFTNHYYWKPDARAAGRLLASEVRSGDAVVVYSLAFSLRYYAPTSIVMVEVPGTAFASDSSAARWIERNVEPTQRLWILQCNAWWMDRPGRFLRVCRSLRPLEREWQLDKLPVYRFGPVVKR